MKDWNHFFLTKHFFSFFFAIVINFIESVVDYLFGTHGLLAR